MRKRLHLWGFGADSMDMSDGHRGFRIWRRDVPDATESHTAAFLDAYHHLREDTSVECPDVGTDLFGNVFISCLGPFNHFDGQHHRNVVAAFFDDVSRSGAECLRQRHGAWLRSMQRAVDKYGSERATSLMVDFLDVLALLPPMRAEVEHLRDLLRRAAPDMTSSHNVDALSDHAAASSVWVSGVLRPEDELAFVVAETTAELDRVRDTANTSLPPIEDLVVGMCATSHLDGFTERSTLAAAAPELSSVVVELVDDETAEGLASRYVRHVEQLTTVAVLLLEEGRGDLARLLVAAPYRLAGFLCGCDDLRARAVLAPSVDVLEKVEATSQSQTDR